MRINLTQGAYRYRPEGEKSAVVVRIGDPAFDLPEEEAARLVALGVAQYAVTEVATAQIQAQETDARKPQPAGQAAQTDDSGPPEDKPEYSVRMTARQLKELMDEHGVAYEDGMTKAQLVQRLDSFFDAYEDESGSDEELPALNAQMPAL